MLLVEKYFLIIIIAMLFFPDAIGKTLMDFPAECFTATEIDDDTRAFNNYNVPTSKADDLDLKKGWYRIMGRLANSLKQGFDKALVGSKHNAPNFCGTVYAGTLMGEHPTVEEGMIEMTVCFRKRFCFYSNIDDCECKSKKKIYVRNCQNHFIYWLSPTGRQERYCTGKTSLTGPKIVTEESNAVECRQHRTFDSSSRVWDEISDVKCDKEQTGWFRFDEGAGRELSSQCSVNEKVISRLAQPCGAAFRGWMVDRHPSLRDGRVNRRICFSYPDSCSCEFYSNIAVRNCGSFFVYHLNSPPICNARYCGATKNMSSAVSDVAKPPSTGVRDICSMYKVMHDPTRLWTHTSPTEFSCDARLYGPHRFGSKFTPWSVKEGCNKIDMQVVTHRCGTRYQGFMEDNHPTVSEGYVERIICFQDATVPCECQFTAAIGVQNCSGYYVYDLRGVPKCESRFCMIANGSDSMMIDPDRPPVYDIPSPGYKIITIEKPVPRDKDGSVITATVLCIIILIILILIVIIIVVMIYIIRPHLQSLRNEKTERNDDDYPDYLKPVPGAPPPEDGYSENEMKKLPDSEDEADATANSKERDVLIVES